MDDVTLPLLMTLERLSPLERAGFLLELASSASTEPSAGGQPLFHFISRLYERTSITACLEGSRPSGRPRRRKIWSCPSRAIWASTSGPKTGGRRTMKTFKTRAVVAAMALSPLMLFGTAAHALECHCSAYKTVNGHQVCIRQTCTNLPPLPPPPPTPRAQPVH